MVARYLDSGRLECSSAVSSGSGALALELSLNGQQFSSSGVQYTYVSAASVSSVWPSTAVSEGSSALTVSGSGFSALSESLGYLRCRIGSTSVLAQYLSESSLVCNTTASSSAGYVSVEVSTNAREYTSDGVQLELVDVVVSDVSPWTGPELGGTVVTVSGSGLDTSELWCRFGSLVSVSASVHGSSEVRCVSPSGLSSRVGQRLSS